MTEFRRLRQLEENSRSKRLVAGISLDMHICQKLCENRLRPASRPELAQWSHGAFQVSCARACPLAVHYCGHRTEYQCRALEKWAYRRGVQLDFIRPGKPVENAFIESFNGRLRDECLNVHQFAGSPRHSPFLKRRGWTTTFTARTPHSVA